MQWSFKALGTTWWIELFEELDIQTSDEVKNFVAGFVQKYEQHYSRFIPQSTLSILNKNRELANPSVELVELLTYGKQLYLRSDTHFNLLTGHILEARGYDAEYSFIDTQAHTLELGNPITDLEITPTHIRLHQGNIDLGGFGKGYLIDLLADAFKETFSLTEFLINGGGDMYATHQAGKPITIHLEHPINLGTYIGTTSLYNQGFAASSPHRRLWRTATGTQHHIVSQHITNDGTFVIASSAADADAFATTLLQSNPAQTQQIARDQNIAVAHIAAQAGTITTTKNFTLVV